MKRTGSILRWMKPMLSHTLSATDLVADPSFACEEKVQGWRAQITVVGGHLTSILSRNNKPIEGPGLKRLLATKGPTNLTCLLDGELYVPGGTESDVAHHIANGIEDLRYAVFEPLHSKSHTLAGAKYEKRRVAALSICKGFNSPLIHLVKRFADATAAFADAEERGVEGIILKRLDSVYQSGKRSWDWLKVKVVEDFDVIIVAADAPPTKWTVTPGNRGKDGILYPEGKLASGWREGRVGLVYGFWDPRTKKTVSIGTLGPTRPREEQEKLVGKVVVVKTWGVCSNGGLKHPQLQLDKKGKVYVRFDKNPKDCILPDAVRVGLERAAA